MSYSTNDVQADDENDPDVFCADSLMSWALFLITVPFSGYVVFVFPLLCLGVIDPPPMDPPGKEFAVLIARVLGGFLLLPLTISVAVDLWMMRKPVIHVYREGLIVRSFKKQKEFSILALFLGGEILLLFIAFWRLVTLKAFRIKTYYFRWEELEPMWVTNRGLEINKKGKLSSPLLPGTYFTIDDYSIHFDDNYFFTYRSHVVGNIINRCCEDLHKRAKLKSWVGQIPNN